LFGEVFEVMTQVDLGFTNVSRFAPCSFGLSATSKQYFSLRTNQPPATSQQYFSLRTNQHQSSAISQTNRPLTWLIRPLALMMLIKNLGRHSFKRF
jgi:hypothetical protein